MFRFTIRDVLWLTVVVAMGVGWWLHYARLTRQYSKTAAEAKESKRVIEAAMITISRFAQQIHQLEVQLAETNAGSPEP
jgi:hypothetical protein